MWLYMPCMCVFVLGILYVLCFAISCASLCYFCCVFSFFALLSSSLACLKAGKYDTHGTALSLSQVSKQNAPHSVSQLTGIHTRFIVPDKL